MKSQSIISFHQAVELVLTTKRDFGAEEISLAMSLHRILAQDVLADRGFPPFDRVTMDGIAISSEAFSSGIRSYTIENMQRAGAPQLSLNNRDCCIEVMTGAVLPANTDAVVPYEQCMIKEGVATVDTGQVLHMQNVHRQNTDCKAGDVLVRCNEKVTPAVTGIIASAGLTGVAVKRLPKVAVCSTGDELIAVAQQPQPHQVRRSNAYMLAAALQSLCIEPTVQHLPDDAEVLAAEIKQLLMLHDVLIFSGAVSQGKYDFLPEVLRELGMHTILQGVAQRPGKPFLFGEFSTGQIVFAFPGNPASTFVCYHKYFKPWLNTCINYSPPKCSATLTEDVVFKPGLSLHLLVKFNVHESILQAKPVFLSTSGDMVQLATANGIMTLPAEREVFKAGEVFEVDKV